MDLDAIRSAASEFLAYAANVERGFKKSRTSAPSLEERQAFANAFWDMLARVRRAVGDRPSADAPEAHRVFGDMLRPLLFRSELIARSALQPHGFPGDYRTFELIYDLESDLGSDPTGSAIPNCLAYTYSTIPAVRGGWERRHALARLIERHLERGPVRMLDVACGGARYLRDVIARSPHVERLEVLCVDQDASAVAFLNRLPTNGARIDAQCMRLSDLPQVIEGRKFDLTVASGLTDYLDDLAARSLFELFAAHLVEGGALFTSNLIDVGDSPFFMDWITSWPIIHRDEAGLRAILPERLTATITLTADGSLLLAEAQ